MQFKKKVYCHLDLIKFIGKNHLISKDDGSDLTLSVIDGDKDELMIFLEKSNSDYEVRVYKASPANKYIPHKADNVNIMKKMISIQHSFLTHMGKLLIL